MKLKYRDYECYINQKQLSDAELEVIRRQWEAAHTGLPRQPILRLVPVKWSVREEIGTPITELSYTQLTDAEADTPIIIDKSTQPSKR